MNYRRLTETGWPRGFQLAQFPNPPLILALAASLAGALTRGTPHRYSSAVFYLALGVWAYQEASTGVNWFRRLLGVGFAIYLVVRVARALHG
jgi:hypothetical protein